MTTIVINEDTKIGKDIVEMLRSISKIDKSKSFRILDETEFLLSTKANKSAILQGIEQVKNGEERKTIKVKDLWK